MSPARWTGLRPVVRFTACALLAVLAPVPLLAAPKPLAKEEQAKVDRAIERGIAYLKNTQRRDGSWPVSDGPPEPYAATYYPIGYTLLPALALLESGAPTDDPCVQKAAESLRRNLAKVKITYEASLAVLLLDRLGDPRDEELVRDLALRLVAFQGYSGWGYRCPTLSKKNRDDLQRALHDPPKQEQSRPGVRKAPPAQVPPTLKRLAIFRPDSELLPPTEPIGKQNVLFVGTTDNSNTQCAAGAVGGAAARRPGRADPAPGRQTVSPQPAARWHLELPLPHRRDRQ